jgi:hypothetical protein
MAMSQCMVLPLILSVALAAGCNRSRSPEVPNRPAADGRPRLQLPGGLVSSPFLSRCQTTPPRERLLAQLVDKALGADRGEVMWANRSFGTGGAGGGGDVFETTADYGGRFNFRKGDAESAVTADDADAILQALRAGLRAELEVSGARILGEDVTTNGKRVSDFRQRYEDPGMPAAGEIEASIALPTGDRGIERLAVLKLIHRETSRSDRLPDKK